MDLCAHRPRRACDSLFLSILSYIRLFTTFYFAEWFFVPFCILVLGPTCCCHRSVVVVVDWRALCPCVCVCVQLCKLFVALQRIAI